VADRKLQGTHRNTVKAGRNCGGKVRDGSCKDCGADFIPPKNIRKAAARPAKGSGKAR
jgi:uncharacterized OB-fold protein